MLWDAFLSLLLIGGMLMIIMIFLVFIIGAIRGYRSGPRQSPPAEPGEPFVKPFAEPPNFPAGPMLGDKTDENPNEFCPVCHYHWSVCANVHTLHHEHIPFAPVGTMRSIQE